MRILYHVEKLKFKLISKARSKIMHKRKKVFWHDEQRKYEPNTYDSIE